MTDQEYAQGLERRLEVALEDLREQEVFVRCLHELNKVKAIRRHRLAERLVRHFDQEEKP